MSDFVDVGNKYRRAHRFANHHLRPLAKAYEMWIYLIHNSFIPADCEVSDGVIFGYRCIVANVLMTKDASYGSVGELPRNSCGTKIANRVIPQGGLVGTWHE